MRTHAAEQNNAHLMQQQRKQIDEQVPRSVSREQQQQKTTNASAISIQQT